VVWDEEVKLANAKGTLFDLFKCVCINHKGRLNELTLYLNLVLSLH